MTQFKTDASETNGEDLVSFINFLCDSNATSYPIADKVRNSNAALKELVAEIITADGNWQFQDTNIANLSEGTITLIASQADYSFNEEFLAVEQISIKDVNGNWRVLKHLDPREFKDVAIEEYFAATGLPTYYDVIGDTIFLYPAPIAANVTLAAGLKVRFKEDIDIFTTSDTTQEPGIPSTHHSLVAYMASIPYCLKYKQDRVALYEKKVMDMKKTLIDIYVNRNKDDRPQFTTSPIDNYK